RVRVRASSAHRARPGTRTPARRRTSDTPTTHHPTRQNADDPRGGARPAGRRARREEETYVLEYVAEGSIGSLSRAVRHASPAKARWRGRARSRGHAAQTPAGPESGSPGCSLGFPSRPSLKLVSYASIR